MTKVHSTSICREYGELPASDHREGYMWRVDYFDSANNRIESTTHMNLSDAEAAMLRTEINDEEYTDERYSGGPGSLIDETYDPDDYPDEPLDGDYDPYDESMDGDHDSAMASAGMGTDEDYGYYGDCE